MYYRRKILLALVQAFGGKVNNTDFQKYLFLFNKATGKAHYNFIPYKYGCFSFQSYSDKRALARNNILKDYDDAWIINEDVDFISMLSSPDRHALDDIKKSFSSLKGDDLIKYLYTKYPYYATRSEVLDRLLTPEEIEIVSEKKNCDNSIKLFTIGYENRDVDEFINLLLLNNVRLLCDVRRNPVSMKYGFSKKQLKETIEKTDIEYVHIPQLGIDSEKRKCAAFSGDYKRLFDEYSDYVKRNGLAYINNILHLLSVKRRVALLCFEYAPSDCHRSRLAHLLSSISGNKLNVVDL